LTDVATAARPETATRPDTAPDAAVPISLTVSTRQGWQEIAAALRTWQAAAEAAGGEAIVVDGSGLEAPTREQAGSNVRWLSHPGESIFQLRHRAYEAALGEIVAATEDHVYVPPDWGTRMIAAHRRHPEAAAIGGSMTNGATETIMDWASFLVVQGPFIAPARSGPAKRLVGVANVSYKRWALERFTTHEGMGAMDALDQRELARAGALLVHDDSIRVAHVQALGFRGTTALHFHAGRTISGFYRKRMNAVHVARILGAPIVPLARFIRALVVLAPKGNRSLLVRCTPAMLWLFYSQGLGQFIGYVAGEGDSPRHVM
jgi:hypothetical protein